MGRASRAKRERGPRRKQVILEPPEPVEERLERWRSPSWDSSAPLTAEMLQSAIVNMEQRDSESRQRVAERLKALKEQVPKELHGHEIVQTIEMVIQADQPIHPDDHKHLTEGLAILLRDHERSHSHSGLWVPGDPL